MKTKDGRNIPLGCIISVALFIFAYFAAALFAFVWAIVQLVHGDRTVLAVVVLAIIVLNGLFAKLK